MMLIKNTGESLKFIGSKCIQESLINTSRLGLTILSFSKKARQKCWPMRARIYFKTKTNDRVALRLTMGLWNICCVRNTAIICWPPRKVTALQVVRTLFLCPRPRLSPPWNKPILDIPKSESSIVYRIPTENGPWIQNWRSSSTAYPYGRRMTFFIFSFVSFVTSLRLLGLVVSESRVPSLSFPGGIFTRQVAPASVQGRRILRLVLVMGANTVNYDIRCLLNNIHYQLPWLHVGLSTPSSSRFSKKFPVISQKVAQKNYQKLLFVTKVAQKLLKKTKNF